MPSSEPEVREEIALLAAIGRGERGAFRGLYARYSAPLLSLALRFVGDRGAAEEVLQDAFVKIWQHAGGYDSRLSRPFTWAVTIVRRTAIDHLRKHRHAAAVHARREEVPASAESATRETAEARETAEQLHRILTTIAPPQRDALELALFSTLTHVEIAARLAQPVGTVKTWIRRGLRELHATLNASPS